MDLSKIFDCVSDFDILNKWDVDALCEVEWLEQFIIFLPFIHEHIDLSTNKNIIVDMHEGLYIFETDSIFKGPGEEEEIFDNSWPFLTIFLQVFIRLFYFIGEGFVWVSLIF